jgi:hypothetical protein
LLAAFGVDPSIESPPQTLPQDEIGDYPPSDVLAGNLHVNTSGDGISLGILFRNPPLAKKRNEYFVVEQRGVSDTGLNDINRFR